MNHTQNAEQGEGSQLIRIKANPLTRDGKKKIRGVMNGSGAEWKSYTRLFREGETGNARVLARPVPLKLKRVSSKKKKGIPNFRIKERHFHGREERGEGPSHWQSS